MMRESLKGTGEFLVSGLLKVNDGQSADYYAS